MNMLIKTATAGALALALTASSLNTVPAKAGDNGAGLAIGLATGLIVGGIILNNQRHHSQRYAPQAYFGNTGYNGYNDGPRCYLGPQQVRWEQQCQQDDYTGDTYCHPVKHFFRQQICN